MARCKKPKPWANKTESLHLCCVESGQCAGKKGNLPNGNSAIGEISKIVLHLPLHFSGKEKRATCFHM
jgi:hypothetical protein